MTHTSDVVILGGGSGGYAAALRAAQLGMSVTVIEQDKLGGTCLHRGCIPTKALLHSGEIADAIRTSAVVGIRSSLQGIEPAAVHQYKDRIVNRLYKGLQGLMSRHNVEVVTGCGRYVGERCINVDGERFTGEAVVLATGSRSRSVPGLEIGGRVVTSDQALELDVIPQHVVVLGGGVIGVEFASLWTSFGAQVSIVESLPRLIASEDEWTSEQLARALRKRGISIKTSAVFAGADQSEDGVVVQLDSGQTLEADLLLVAVGRAPRTDVGLAEAGIELQNDFVVVDANLRTNHDNLYAVGDIVAGPQLAHRGFQHGLFVAEHIAGREPAALIETQIPKVTYSNPEVASIGLTERRARDMHGTITSFVYDLAGNGKSQILGTGGGIKVIRTGSADDQGPVVGVHMVGARVSELVSEAQLVVNWQAYPDEVAQLIHAHPTLSEAFGEAQLALAGRPLHSHSAQATNDEAVGGT